MKRIEIIDNKFTITDVDSSVIEFQHSAIEVKHFFSNDLIFFYYEVLGEADFNKIRSRGYDPTELVDDQGGTYLNYTEFLSWSNLNTDTGFSANNNVSDYISEYENDLYIYSGFLLNEVPTIKRTKDSVYQLAVGVTDLPTDWSNRLTLTYN